jgi:hypothetical protein
MHTRSIMVAVQGSVQRPSHLHSFNPIYTVLSKSVMKSNECKISQSNMALSVAETHISWYYGKPSGGSTEHFVTQKIYKLSLKAVKWNTFRSIKSRVTVKNRKRSIYQAAVFCFDYNTISLKDYKQQTQSRKKLENFPSLMALLIY